MKRFTPALVLTLISIILIGSGCKKDDSMPLSEYILGNWNAYDIVKDDISYDVLIIFSEETYTIRMSESENPLNYTDFDPEIYTIDDGQDIITIKRPQFPGEAPSSTNETFNVIWTETSNTMTWEPRGTYPGAIIWTKSSGNNY